MQNKRHTRLLEHSLDMLLRCCRSASVACSVHLIVSMLMEILERGKLTAVYERQPIGADVQAAVDVPVLDVGPRGGD